MTTESENLLSAWAALFVAHALTLQRIEKSLSGKAPLNLYEYDILLTIQRAPGKKLRYSEVVSASVFTKSGITRIMKRFEAKKYIERVTCESDQRGAYALLGQKGEKALQETWKLYRKAILEILSPALTPNQAKNLESTMEKIIEQLRGSPLVQIGSSSR